MIFKSGRIKDLILTYFIFLYLFIILVVLEMNPSDLHMLYTCSITKLYLQPLIFILFLKKRRLKR
jgi:hypothetical protein